jgi:hypothetical protein
MYGSGLGRYGAGSLPDVTIGSDGSLVPLTAFHAWSGIQFYPWEGLTLHGYAGIEQNQASYFGTSGYGNPAYDNSGCMIPTLRASPPARRPRSAPSWNISNVRLSAASAASYRPKTLSALPRSGTTSSLVIRLAGDHFGRKPHNAHAAVERRFPASRRDLLETR